MYIEIQNLVIAHGFAITWKLQLALYQACIFKFFQMHDQQRPADPDLTRKLADVVSLIDERRDNLQPMWVRKGRKSLKQTRTR